MRGRATLDGLAREFCVSTRTVRRDLEVMSEVGIPIRKTTDAGWNEYSGFWFIDHGNHIRGQR
jgi:predicted DNA-binding transcriptional regulator YafY